MPSFYESRRLRVVTQDLAGMGVSYETARSCLKTIYRKHKVRSCPEAVLKYVRNQRRPALAF